MIDKDKIISQLKQQLAEKDKEINKLKEPKKYVYNCLSFVSNSDAFDVAKYIEDLHQTIAQNNEELDEYIEKIKKLEIELAEKNKALDGYFNYFKSFSCKDFDEFRKLIALTKISKDDKERDDFIRHEICEKIRKKADKRISFYDGAEELYVITYTITNEILDQIERGEE